MSQMLSEMESIFHWGEDGKASLHVHVDNGEDLRAVKTEEVEAAHFSSLSFPLPATGPATAQADYNQNLPVQILQLDPDRKRAVISVNGSGQCFICHSQQQAQSLQFGATQNADEAALYTAPFAFTAEATGPLWAVLSNIPVTPASNTPGTFTTATGAANATTTLTIPSAGAGLADILQNLNYVFSAASLNATTLTVTSGSDVLYETVIPTGATAGTIPTPLIGQPGQTIVITLTAGGTAITSTLNATYQQQSNGSITVGVLQERRGA